MMMQSMMVKRALLALLVGVLSTPMVGTIPPAVVVAESDEVAVSHHPGWMVWYEDETFEDCGVSVAPDQCTDEWQPAFSRFVTEAECRQLAFDYNKKSREEFQCAIARPPAKTDDISHP